jgi:7-keto-8-aminopelargonate synthetase-like enzyme
MRKNFYDRVFFVMQEAARMGFVHVTTDSKGFRNDSFDVDGKPKINFALCDYLALNRDERIKNAAINEIRNHGVFTSISKVYLKLDLYEMAEEMLSKVFGSPVVLFTRTTLAHIGTLPVITDSQDAIILDQQVHTSVHLAADMLKGYGNHIETIRHSRMDLLEERIRALKKTYRHIWYLADGVYSTYGDKLPTDDIKRLLDEYEQFHVYIDDSHGMSWYGENGKGYISATLATNPKMVVATSINKGFGVEGGVIVCHDIEFKKRLSTCAAPLIFTGPLSPGALGGIIESGKIHLSDEINQRQAKLKSLIDLATYTSKGLGLPLISDGGTPILFFATGESYFCADMCASLYNKGYYVTGFHYPAVPLNNSGIRITVNLYLTENDIKGMLITMRKEYDKALKARNLTFDNILKHYKTAKVVA